MSANKAKEFVEGKNNCEEIKRQMESAMAMLLSIGIHSLSTKTAPKSIHSTSEIAISSVNSASNRLPRKRIDIAFRPEDFNRYKLFYGYVSVKWERDERRNKYRILLYHIKKEHMVCRISITEAVYKHINRKYKFDDQRKCNVVFLAIFTVDSGKNYQSTYLRLGDDIIIQESS